MHTPLHAYESVEQALSMGVVDRALHSPTRWRLPLSPAMWDFHLAPRLAEAPAVAAGVGFEHADWTPLQVPLSWEMAGHGAPQYTNVRYPPPLDVWRAPYVDADANPVGSYQRSFVVPDHWFGRRVFLHLDGVASAMTVWVNGLRVGYSQDSKLPAEFDVTTELGCGSGSVVGEHVLSVQVVKWSDGSYLEDQDQWWLSGIQRHAFLYCKPTELSIANYGYSFEPGPVERGGASVESASTAGARVHVRVRLEGTALNGLTYDDGPGPARVPSLEHYAVVASLYGPTLVTPGEPAPERPLVWRAALPIQAYCNQNVVFGEGPEVLMQEGAGGRHTVQDGDPVTHGGIGAHTVVPIAAPALWSAEVPSLYTLVIELRRRRRRGAVFRAGGDEWSDAKSASVDVEACWAGLRHVTLTGGLLRVNGAPLTVRGVNRHEHCPTGGKAVPWETMLTDARLLKQHSFNAVRCSHYPNDSGWYELCDALGLYLVDEANIETHGFAYTGDEGRLSKRLEWRHAFLMRFTRMVQRDYNHASVIVWSLGNEAGYGDNHEALARWCRLHEPSRPVQYESCGGNTCTDIICPMYPSEETMAALATVRGQCASSLQCGQPEPTRYFPAAKPTAHPRPLIVCEYAHGMGNSSGNLCEWWDLFRSLPHCQGGFIWDWVDQGLDLPPCEPATDKKALVVAGRAGSGTPTGGTRRLSRRSGGALSGGTPSGGARRWGYGGDFGEVIHDARFCINGLVFPDRTPHPGLLEAKYVMQPVALSVESFSWPDDTSGASAGRRPSQMSVTLHVENRYDLLDLAHLSCELSLELGGALLARVCLSMAQLPAIEAHSSREFDTILPLLPLASRTAALTSNPLLGSSPLLTARFTLTHGTNWAATGHEVARIQCPVPPPPAALSLAPLPPPETLVAAAASGERVARGASPGSAARRPRRSPSRSKAAATEVAEPAGAGGEEGALRCVESAEAFDVCGGTGAEHFELRLSRASGELEAIRVGGELVLEAGGRLQLWRAPTDNDEGSGLNAVANPKDDSISNMVWWLQIGVRFARRCPNWIIPLAWSAADLWRSEGLHNLTPRVRHVRRCPPPPVAGGVASGGEGRLDFETVVDHYAGRILRATHAVRTSVLHSGAVMLINEATVYSTNQEGLPRVGLEFRLPTALAQATWLGQGPHENYVDRSGASVEAQHSSGLEGMYTPYIFPSDNGHRSDTQWLALHTPGGCGLWLGGNQPSGFSAQRYSAAALSAAKHQDELTPSDAVHLHVDHRMGGVGGDTGWSRSVRAPYRVPPGTHRWALLLRPFTDAAALHRVPALPTDWSALADGGFPGGLPPFEPLRFVTRCWVHLSQLRRLGNALILVALLVALLACALGPGYARVAGAP